MRKILLAVGAFAFVTALVCPEKELGSTTDKTYCSNKTEKPILLSSPNPEKQKTETSPLLLEEVVKEMSNELNTHFMNISTKLDDYTNLFAEMMKRPPPATETQLKASPYSPLQPQLYFVLRRPSRGYGKPELLQTLELSAEYMHRYYGTALVVGDLSSARGGRLPPHKSHRRGLDADVGIYWHQEGWYENKYGRLKGKLEEQTLAINWDFIKVLQDAGDIDYVFWNRRYISAMKNYVLSNCGKAEWEQYGKVLHHEPGHTDHFHVRVLKGMTLEKDRDRFLAEEHVNHPSAASL